MYYLYYHTTDETDYVLTRICTYFRFCLFAEGLQGKWSETNRKMDETVYLVCFNALKVFDECLFFTLRIYFAGYFSLKWLSFV